MLIPANVFEVGKVSARADSSRYGLVGVRVERDKDGTPVAVATDANRLIVARWKEADHDDYPSEGIGSPAPVPGFSATVPSAAWAEVGAAARKLRGGKPVLANVVLVETAEPGAAVAMGCTDLTTRRTTSVLPLDKSYPPWRNVLPKYRVVSYPAKENRAVMLAVDGKMIASLIQSVMAVTGSETAFLTVPLAPGKPVLVHGVSDGGVSVKAVQMTRTDTLSEVKVKPEDAPPDHVPAGFHIETREVAGSEYWVVVGKDGKVIAQQPIEIELIAPGVKNLEDVIRVKPAEEAAPEPVAAAANDAPQAE